MTTVDKAAIGWSIAIVAIGVAIAFAGAGGQDLGVSVPVPQAPSAPSTTETPTVEETQTDPFAELASEVRESSEEMEAEVEEMASDVKEEIEAEVEEEMEAVSGPQTIMVDMPAGTAVPGCEETDECYIPSSVTINAGDTVEWTNSDTAAHTVTGGSPADGPSGVFDSSLVLGGATYAFTFEEAGNYDYFCMVHPWMVGNVQVN